jgi:hypothetical protein
VYDQINDYIDHEYHLSSSQNFTINVWVNGTAPTVGKQSSIMSFLTGSIRGIGIDLPASGLPVFIMREAGGTMSYVFSTVSIAGSWHMLTGTYNTATNTMEFFVDGVSMGTRAGQVVLTSSLDRIGSNYVVSSTGEYFGGTIGEVQIYSIPFTQAEVTQQYNATKHQYLGTGDTYVYSTTVSVPDSTANWTFGKDDTTTYIGGMAVDVGGAPVSAWAWEYGATFLDSIGANDGTPSFRTASSATDIDAVIISSEGTFEATVPKVATAGGWTMIDGVPVSPSGMFTDGGTGFPLGPQISTMAAASGDEPESWISLFALALAVGIFVLVYGATHNTKMGRKGSLILASLSGEVVLIYFYITGALAGWELIPAGVLLVFLVFWRKSAAPVD